MRGTFVGMKTPFVESPDVKIYSQPVALVDLMLGSIDERLSYEPSLKFKTLLCFAFIKLPFVEPVREASKFGWARLEYRLRLFLGVILCWSRVRVDEYLTVGRCDIRKGLLKI